MNTKNGAVLWHCTEGKDRCGLLSATILFLLDVSEDDVMEDYLKTNKAAITRVEKLKKKLHLAGLHREKIEKIEGYFVAKEEFLNAALKTMKEDNGREEENNCYVWGFPDRLFPNGKIKRYRCTVH